MSMDFVYDLTEKFEAQKIDYFLVTIRNGDDKDTADIFYNFENERSVECLVEVLKNLNENADKINTDDNDDQAKEKSTKKKASRKKRGRPPKDKGGDK